MRTETTRGRLALLMSTLIVLGAQAERPGVATAQVSLPYPGCEKLGVPLEQHACFHAEFGPFAAVAGDRATPANVDAVHTHYTVQLPTGAGEVTYRPTRAGAFSLFTSVPIALIVLDPQGAAIAKQLSVDSAQCPQLSRVEVYPFVANVRYRILFGPEAQTSVGLVVERLGDFESTYYVDSDSDGFGPAEDSLRTACAPPPGHVEESGDCDDMDNQVNPLAAEVADGRDNDCNGFIDEGVGGEVTQLYYLDGDGDGFGDQDTAFEALTAPDGYIATGGDCNDVRTDIRPGATEVCDNLDNDCDGLFDEGFAEEVPSETPRYFDYDGDGHGSPGWPIVGCGDTAVGAVTDDDCDDVNPALHPSAQEICDGVDNDCDEQVDVSPDGTDVCRQCDPIRLRASWGRHKCDRRHGHAVLNSPAGIRIPRHIAIAQGCAVGKLARLSLRRTDGRMIHCLYRGVGPEYRFQRCTSNVRAGSEVSVQELWLRLKGDRRCGPTRVDLVLAPTTCESPAR